MSKKVSGYATRRTTQTMDGEFYSKHSEDDIQEWLDGKSLNYDCCEVEEVFKNNDTWFDWEDQDYEMEDCEISFEEHSGKESSPQGEVPVECRHDEDIQKFIDERPIKERKGQIKQLTNETEGLLTKFEYLKILVKENFESFKKLVDTDDYENLPEDEKKIYLNLKDVISSAENGILPVSL